MISMTRVLVSSRGAAPVAAGLLALATIVGAARAAAAPEQASAEGAEPAADPSWREHATGDWSGLRDALLRRGLSIDLELLADHSSNLTGGLRRGSVLHGPLRLALALETEPLLGWKGGRLQVSAQLHEGRHGSESLVGDAQGFDNADAPRLRQVSELWFEQTLFRDRVRLRLGKLDAGSDFAHVEHGAEFLSSSAGVSPTILGFPSYPDPATGASVFVFPNRWLYSGIGAYDGATHVGCHGRTGNQGPATLWGEPAALFLIGEAGLLWAVSGRLAGRVGAGVWRHSGTFDRFDGARDEGAEGGYLVFDQALWRERADDEDAQGLDAFAQLGWANRQVSDIDRHLGFGLAWTGAIPGRKRDVLGGMVSTVRFSDVREAGFLLRSETVLEVFYKLALRPWLGVKPDLQYIAHPGGRGTRHALVGTVRALIAF